MRIVDLHGHPVKNDPAIIYCGRGGRHGWKASPLGNPFRGPDWVAQYRAWLREKIAANDPAVMAALRSITPDSQLGCWCCNCDEFDIGPTDEDKVCHVEILIEAWEALAAEGQLTNPSPGA